MQNSLLLQIKILGSAALAAGLVAGCGGGREETARLTPLRDDAVILIYAAGVCEDGNFFRSSYTDEAIAMGMQRPVISRGQGAEFSESALKRLPSVLEQTRPDLMILGYGAMDLWKQTDRSTLKANLGAMIDLARAQGVQVVLLAMPDINRFTSKPDSVYAEVAREKNVPVETEIVRAVLSDSSTRLSRYLLNDEGIQKLAEGIRALCVRSGGLQQ